MESFRLAQVGHVPTAANEYWKWLIPALLLSASAGLAVAQDAGQGEDEAPAPAGELRSIEERRLQLDERRLALERYIAQSEIAAREAEIAMKQDDDELGWSSPLIVAILGAPSGFSAMPLLP